MDKQSYGWDFFESLYKNTLQKGETFSEEMGLEIQTELNKMFNQYKEWLNNKEKNEINDK